MQSYSFFPDRLAGLKGRGGGGGGVAMGALAYPHRDQRSTFLLISDLKQSEVGVLFYSRKKIEVTFLFNVLPKNPLFYISTVNLKQ